MTKNKNGGDDMMLLVGSTYTHTYIAPIVVILVVVGATITGVALGQEVNLANTDTETANEQKGPTQVQLFYTFLKVCIFQPKSVGSLGLKKFFKNIERKVN